MENSHPDVSVIITCYNEMPHLPGNVHTIETVLNATTYTYELIFVDDGSTDTSREIVKDICAKNKNYQYLFHEKNQGRGSAVRDGLLLARGTYAGFLDPDLELPAWYLPAFILTLKEGYDMACGERIEKNSPGVRSIIRPLVSWVYRIISKMILPIRTSDSETGFKFFTMATMREVIQHTKNDRWFWDTEIVANAEEAEKNIASVPIVLIRKPEKKSTVRIIPDSIAHLKALIQYRRDRASTAKAPQQ